MFASLQAKRAAIGELHARLDRVSVEHLDWRRCLKNYDGPETFFFLDPPYVGCVTKTYRPWSQGQMAELAEALSGLSGRWVLTVNDSRENRKLFEGYARKRVQRQRGTANKKADERKMYGELIVRSWK